MLSIFAITEYLPQIEEIIHSEHRLHELVELYDSMKKAPEANSHSLMVDSRGIICPIDWFNTAPPYLLAMPLPFEAHLLLGLLYDKLGNSEKAWTFLQNSPDLQLEIGLKTRLQHAYQISEKELAAYAAKDHEAIFDQYRQQHNMAIMRHYGYLEETPNYEAIQQSYKAALQLAPNSEHQAFTAKHYGTLLIDADQLKEAEVVLQTGMETAISNEANFGLKAVLIQVWMKQLTIPYDAQLLSKLKDSLWEVIQYFEQQERKAEMALLLMDAAHIANISESFSEALGYITKAIKIFEAENLVELAGNALYRKGTLLYTWAQNGQPQFFKPAIESYQEALKIFTKAQAPHIFADIHHNLGVLYTDMPSDSKKKSIWAGVAVSSFQEALEFYTKAAYPYEYGMICNNYGNSFSKFPQAVLTDNYEKSIYYYQEALSVRTTAYPYERAITLLNFLEASWNVGNSSTEFNEERYQDMMVKANEIKTLVKDADMLQEAQKHLDLLHSLKQGQTS